MICLCLYSFNKITAMNKDKEIRNISSPVEVREAEDGPVKIAGYAALYNRESGDMGFIEVIEPGAFANADISDVRALVNHEPDKILGRTSAGTLAVVADEKGLRYEVTLPDTTYANDLAESMRRGDINQSSFAFGGVSDIWEERADGSYLRTIIEVQRIYDVSPVTYPAYNDTTVALRCLEEVKADNKTTKEPGEDFDTEFFKYQMRYYQSIL